MLKRIQQIGFFLLTICFLLATVNFAFIALDGSFSTEALLGSDTLAEAKDTQHTIGLPVKDLKTTTDNPESVFGNLLKWLFGTLGALAVLAIIISGFRYIAAFGNKELIEQAKKNLTYSVIGFVIVLLAYTIASTINYLLGV